LKKKYISILKYFSEDIWTITSDTVTGSRYYIITLVRVFILSIRGFVKDNCVQKASALTYYSLLSIVPTVAMAFGIAKGFGFEKSLREDIQEQFAGHEDIILWVTEFADKYLLSIKGGMIAGIGFIVLLWSVLKLLGSIEESFNEIWNIKRARSFIRMFSDYISLMLIAILFLVITGGLIVYINQRVESISLFSDVSSFFAIGIPYFLVWIVFTLLLYIMPNTQVNFSAALFGGIVSGTLFQILQYYYINFQIGVSQYNAIYGSFAAFPLFLIWLQTSWLIVMLGSEISFAFQNVKSFEFDLGNKPVCYSYKRFVSLAVCRRVIADFIEAKPPSDAATLSYELKLPIRLITDVLFGLVSANVLSEIKGEDKVIMYQPARDVNQLYVSTVINMLEKDGASDIHLEETEKMKKLRSLLDRMNEELNSSQENILLKDI